MAGYLEVDGGVHTPPTRNVEGSVPRRGCPQAALARPDTSRHSIGIDVLRVTLVRIFLTHGLLQFVPGLSPAADLAARTVDTLTLDMSPATSPCGSLRRWRPSSGPRWFRGFFKAGLAILAMAMVSILSPLVLFTGAHTLGGRLERHSLGVRVNAWAANVRTRRFGSSRRDTETPADSHRILFGDGGSLET
jgi:hypothetical protein